MCQGIHEETIETVVIVLRFLGIIVVSWSASEQPTLPSCGRTVCPSTHLEDVLASRADPRQPVHTRLSEYQPSRCGKACDFIKCFVEAADPRLHQIPQTFSPV